MNEETKGTPIVNEEVADWGNQTRIVEPGVTDEQGNEQRTEEVEEKVEDTEETPEEPEYEQPTPVVTVEDPGEFKPNDYSFDVVVYDDESKKPKTVKIKSAEDFDKLLDDDANFGSSGALLKAQRLATKMETSLERDEAEWKKKKDAYEEQAGTLEARNEQIANIAAEINYLVGKGKLPKVEKKYENANWSDPEVAKQPGVKEHLELLSYMRKENDDRKKHGLKSQVSVIDAFNAMTLEKRDNKAKDVKKQAGEARKEAGARVAGSSPAPVSSPAPKGIAVGRGGSLRDINSGW
jgi:hypothetical protein